MSPHSPKSPGQIINLAEFLTAAQASPTASAPLLPPPLTRPYRFEDIGWKPLVNYIPTPQKSPTSPSETDLGWLD
ncbi:hypothetical protein RIF25_16330 [Thermosynechococcaceae cyanobacterium BACA0444]|uniref:Uncharacterized protein n=1 Tax=Pseudocalidococcus azoricus BACA0444 TaxID=2918990 RepID=A0AAE4FW46_9CYAN|nr:hypothetical protein [Pseudocalidococcus azoricus]MDS3862367.1 hypothetical protein [Pseudocalidococcus azoricus BACA0444]